MTRLFLFYHNRIIIFTTPLKIYHLHFVPQNNQVTTILAFSFLYNPFYAKYICCMIYPFVAIYSTEYRLAVVSYQSKIILDK